MRGVTRGEIRSSWYNKMPLSILLSTFNNINTGSRPMTSSACLILKLEKGFLLMQRLRISSLVTPRTCVLKEMSRPANCHWIDKKFCMRLVAGAPNTNMKRRPWYIAAPTTSNLVPRSPPHVRSQEKSSTSWTTVNEAKKLGQLNISVDELIVARSTRDFARDSGGLVDQAKIYRSTKTFSRPTSLSLSTIVQGVEMFP